MDMFDWAKEEVRLACKREAPDRQDGEWDYGCACYESALKAYESMENDGHSGMSWSLTKQILIRLMDGKPLTPIEDVPEVWEECTPVHRSDVYREYQCVRMGSLFKTVYIDGSVKYFDINRYYCKDEGSGATFIGGISASILDELHPITMPYCPDDKPYVFRVHELLTDRKNGDFDTVGVLTLTCPDGTVEEINRYYAEYDDGWRLISNHEFQKRYRMQLLRMQREEEMKGGAE